MAKKMFTMPILWGPLDPGIDPDSGPGSGQGGKEPFLLTYTNWCAMTEYAADLNKDENVDEADYLIWFRGQNGSRKDWIDFGNSAEYWDNNP